MKIRQLLGASSLEELVSMLDDSEMITYEDIKNHKFSEEEELWLADNFNILSIPHILGLNDNSDIKNERLLQQIEEIEIPELKTRINY